MALYPFQERVYDLVSQGKSVILQAPTGSGKTRAALYPFLRAWEERTDFPRKCLYSVPLRVLANQFHHEYDRRTREYGFRRTLEVCIQTGATADDPRLEASLIFTTIDQTLSNYLNIPYALSQRQGNLNAGAVLSSYLVFDELHLFDPECTLPTVLHLLKLVRSVVPFVVMTATLSQVRVEALAKELDAEPVLLSADELAMLPSQQKVRRFHRRDATLEPAAVWELHQQLAFPRRSIAVCNTVDRAQTLYEGLRQQVDDQTEVRLLHSRFYQRDRQQHEAWLQREFGKEQSQRTAHSAILVATQVVEVGLDITSQALHTELAPAASIVQRAGRCARYQGEVGDVFVYRLPTTEGGGANYAPYLGKAEQAICDLAWSALEAYDGKACGYREELAIVDAAHEKADRQLIDQLHAGRFHKASDIAQTMATQDLGKARDLIRDVDSRTIIVHPNPDTIANPWAYEGFSLHRGSLFGAYDRLAQRAAQVDAEWVIKAAYPQAEDEENPRAPTVWKWHDVVGKEDMLGFLLFAVHPLLARYDGQTGFQLGVANDHLWESRIREQLQKKRDYPPYRKETLQEHVTRMLNVWHHGFFDRATGKMYLPLAEEVAYAFRRLENREGWPAGLLDRLAVATIVAHDLGKLDVQWQQWAHRWQAEVSLLRGTDMAIPDDYLAAHTDYDDHNPTEKALNQKLHDMRPYHAAESAAAAEDWLWAQDGVGQSLARAALTAIIHHHNASACGEHSAFHAHPAAPTAFRQMLQEAAMAETNRTSPAWSLPAGEELVNRQIRFERPEELLPYLLLVRVLRLADQRSQA